MLEVNRCRLMIQLPLEALAYLEVDRLVILGQSC
jgi:hypothetical protein